jgi:thiol-disulfide isomerase/thioredoxin
MKFSMPNRWPYFFSLICLLILSSFYCKAQSSNNLELITATVGKACPPFSFTDVQHYTEKAITSEGMKGKPMILDFFASYCAVCFEGFPEINRIQNQFKGRLQVVLVGNLDSTIKRVYEKFNLRYHLDLPVVYDSVIFKKWQIVMTPYEVWIDEKGIVRAITSPLALTESNIRTFLEHGTLGLPLSKNKQQFQEDTKSFNYQKPLLVNGNAGNDSNFLYRSLLAPWKNEQGVFHAKNIMHEFGNTFQGVAIPLGELYELAYGDTVTFYTPPRSEDGNEPNKYGQWLLKPVVKVKDTALFKPDFIKCKNLFDYSLILPVKAASAYYLQQAMRNDLKNYFGYRVKVAWRQTDYWKLVTTRKWRKKLISKGASARETFTYAGVSLQNISMKEVIALIHSVSQWEIFVDKTGIQKNIDLHIDAIMTDFNDVRKALAEKGLFLKKARKKIKTIIIYDSKSQIH